MTRANMLLIDKVKYHAMLAKRFSREASVIAYSVLLYMALPYTYIIFAI